MVFQLYKYDVPYHITKSSPTLHHCLNCTWKSILIISCGNEKFCEVILQEASKLNLIFTEAFLHVPVCMLNIPVSSGKKAKFCFTIACWVKKHEKQISGASACEMYLTGRHGCFIICTGVKYTSRGNWAPQTPLCFLKQHACYLNQQTCLFC